MDWDDSEAFKEVIRRRVKTSTGLDEPFEQMWSKIVDAHIGTRDSFGYVVDRTLMRPRDLLMFLHAAIGVAVNRGHERVA